MAIVNTVVIVQAKVHRPQNDVAVALGHFGSGSMLAPLLLPRVLDRLPDRTVIILGIGLGVGLELVDQDNGRLIYRGPAPVASGLFALLVLVPITVVLKWRLRLILLALVDLRSAHPRS